MIKINILFIYRRRNQGRAGGHQGHVPPRKLEGGQCPPFQSHAYNYMLILYLDMVRHVTFVNKAVLLYLPFFSSLFSMSLNSLEYTMVGVV